MKLNLVQNAYYIPLALFHKECLHSAHRHASKTTSKMPASSDANRGKNSFPQIGSFAAKPYSRPLAPNKAYEVHPGIWSTDATAKVFGYVQNDGNNDVTGPPQGLTRNWPNRRSTPLRTPRLAKKLLYRYREVHNEDGTDDFASRTHRRHVEDRERSRQKKRDETRKGREKDLKRADRRRMSAVSSGDELIQRGANPRTGLITPHKFSDGSEDSASGTDYLSGGELQKCEQRKKKGVGRWKQDNIGWNLVQTPPLSSDAKSPGGYLGQTVSVRKLQDTFVVNMPSVDNPKPVEMTVEQIRKYQECVERVCNPRKMAEPAVVPVGPVTSKQEIQQNQPHKIRRKEVGTGLQQSANLPHIKDRSACFTAISQNRMRQMETTVPENHHSARISPQKEPSNDIKEDTSSGLNCGEPFYQPTTTTLLSPSRPPRQLKTQPIYASKSIPCAEPINVQLSQSLSQYLPRVHFLHPTHLANLTRSYRRPTELLPAHLRTIGRDKRESGAIATVPVGLPGAARPEERPRVKRHDGAAIIPRVETRNSKQANNYMGDIKSRQTPRKHAPVLHFMGCCCKGERMEIPSSQVAAGKEKGLGITDLGPRQFEISNNNSESMYDTENLNGTDPAVSFTRPRALSQDSRKLVPYPMATDGNMPQALRRPFAHCLEAYQGENSAIIKNPKKNEEGIMHRDMVLSNGIETRKFCTLLELLFHALFKMKCVQHWVTQVTRHVFETLHHSPTALKILRMPNADFQTYLTAIKHILLASCYTLAMIYILNALRKVAKLVAEVLHLVLLPLRIFFLVFRYLILR